MEEQNLYCKVSQKLAEIVRRLYTKICRQNEVPKEFNIRVLVEETEVTSDEVQRPLLQSNKVILVAHRIDPLPRCPTIPIVCRIKDVTWHDIYRVIHKFSQTKSNEKKMKAIMKFAPNVKSFLLLCYYLRAELKPTQTLFSKSYIARRLAKNILTKSGEAN